jgi:aconitate hydratase
MILQKAKISNNGKEYSYFSLKENVGKDVDLERLPKSIKILLENSIRNYDERLIKKEHLSELTNWGKSSKKGEVGFIPTRIVLQDFTGVPAVVDLAAMRDALYSAGKDPSLINPNVPVDLVIDHSLMVDDYGNKSALHYNVDKEFERNEERYRFLKWAQNSFENFRVTPPSTGIIHQVNLEYLASVVDEKETENETLLFPDSLVGTDSHTTMINGLGILGWGVGGIEAEAGMLGQPLYFLTPDVIGVNLKGNLKEGVTATDLALRITQLLREHNVVGKFVEYFGEGAKSLSLPDRATISNMAPEYGATIGFFPVDDETLKYMKLTGRSDEHINLVRSYLVEQGLFDIDIEQVAKYSDVIELDLSTVVSSLAGPKRPQDRVNLNNVKKNFLNITTKPVKDGGFGYAKDVFNKSVDLTNYIDKKEKKYEKYRGVNLDTGSIVIAAITSCTNTSNPSVMLGAGLIAKKAVEKGLSVPSYVKTSLTPGSLVVTEYLKKAGLLFDLEKLGFHVAGYGCATCIGNSGPLDEPVTKAIVENDLLVGSVLSGNRNFEGRVHQHVKANYLASPILVVAYALSGRLDIEFEIEPIGKAKDGSYVYLKDLWPSNKEIYDVIKKTVSNDLFTKHYKNIFEDNKRWNSIKNPEGVLYNWEENSTYIRKPEFFSNLMKKENLEEIKNAKTLLLLGDSITTDHISPAGAIGRKSPASKYLKGMGINENNFNSYGSRRGNHEVMMRGTFANIRIHNKLANGKEGGFTRIIGQTNVIPVYDVAMTYKKDNIPLLVLAGKEYGTGSSRDWAAKGTNLLGIKAVVARSYERIHRSNLVGMGVLPLQFKEGESAESLSLTGEETFSFIDLDKTVPGGNVKVKVKDLRGNNKTFEVILRLDSDIETEYYLNGGILQSVLMNIIDN